MPTNAWQDVAARAKLNVRTYKDIGARIKFAGFQGKDVGARSRLGIRGYADPGARFSMYTTYPTALQTAPVDAAVVAVNATRLFSWTYYETLRPSSTQSAYALRRRRLSDNRYEWWNAATSSWTTTELYNTSGTASVTLGANTWTYYAGSDYAWAVSVKNDLASASGYATERRIRFTLPVTPAITGPASITVANPTVTWTAVGQTAYRVRAIVSGVAVSDSGKLYSASVRTYQVGPVANGASVTLEVRVWNGDDYEGPVVTSVKAAAYTGPTTPTVVGSTPAGRPLARLVITNPAGGDTFSSNQVWRSLTGAAGSYVLIASGLATGATYDDYTVGAGISYWYIVRAVGTSDTYTDSAVI